MFQVIRQHGTPSKCHPGSFDLIKLDGEDYRHHQTSLGARKPAHSSAGGGGGGGGTPRK